MHTNSDHENLGVRWLFGAGVAAIAFCFFLIWADDYLAGSTAEAKHAEDLREIRTAQSVLGSHVTDARQLVVAPSVQGEDHASGDHGHEADDHDHEHDHAH